MQPWARLFRLAGMPYPLLYGEVLKLRAREKQGNHRSLVHAALMYYLFSTCRKQTLHWLAGCQIVVPGLCSAHAVHKAVVCASCKENVFDRNHLQVCIASGLFAQDTAAREWPLEGLSIRLTAL